VAAVAAAYAQKPVGHDAAFEKGVDSVRHDLRQMTQIGFD